MTVSISRRSVIRSAAWSVPVIAAAIATPLAAASTPPAAPLRDRLKFNTARSWDENPWDAASYANKPRISVVVAVMDKTGPDTIGSVSIIVNLVDSAGVSQTQSTTQIITTPWGATPDWTVHFDNAARGKYTVTVTATANGVQTISKQMNERTATR